MRFICWIPMQLIGITRAEYANNELKLNKLVESYKNALRGT